MRCGKSTPYNWGFHKLKFDESQLAFGKIALLECSGVFPDGTPFSLPHEDINQLALEIPPGTRNATVALALPSRRPGIIEESTDPEKDSFARIKIITHDVHDINSNTKERTTIMVGKLHLKIALKDDVSTAYRTLALTHVEECRADKQLILDPTFIATTLDCAISPLLQSFINEVPGLLRQRGDIIATRLSQLSIYEKLI